jgi:hypothetical membrane protein
MRNRTVIRAITRCALASGVAIPVLYYGIQAVAAPFFPGFSFLETTASELGSDRSRCANIFNHGVISLGVLMLFASCGFFEAFRRPGTFPVLGWLAALGIAMTGVQTVGAGYYPLPDPRHAGQPVFLVAMLLLPVVLAIAMWPLSRWGLKLYFILNLVLLVTMVPLMSAMSGIDTHAYRGGLQRVFALTVFPPIGVAACALLKRTRSAEA